MIVGVISNKGGVGKTTTVANLAVALASVLKKRVLAVDCNFDSPDLPLHFDMYPPPPSERTVRGRVIYPHNPSGVDLLPASSLNGGTPSDLKWFLGSLKYDFILLDAPPVEAELVLKLSDSVLVVTTPDVPAVQSALRAIEASRRRKLGILGVEVNRARKDGYEVSHAELVSTFDIPLLATILDTKKIPKSLADGCPVVLRYPHCKAAVEFKKLAVLLLGKKYQVKTLEKVIGLLKG